MRATNRLGHMGLLDRLIGRGSRPSLRRPRAGARVSIEERASMRRVRDGSDHTVILANLSWSGARIATPLRLSKGEEVTLVIDAGRRPPFTLGCKVVATQQRSQRLHRDYGVQFVAVRPGDIERLRSFVASRADARTSGAAFI